MPTADRWSASLGLRYAYTGFSKFFVADVRAQYRISRSWLVSAGIDNFSNDCYWAFHPYPQRTYHAELRFDL
jgi:iron complex outermembrane receptor protein